MSKIKTKNNKSKFRQFYLFNLVYQLGFSIILPILIGVLFGVWLDKKLLTSPLFTLSGVVIGIIISIVAVWDDIKELMH